MSPRPADPTVRAALVEAAARVLATEGPHALKTRRLATEVGTSTMAVYTHFGSMDEVHRAVRREGFARLTARLDAPARVDDPVAELAAVGSTYLAFGAGDPELYRAMFLHQPPDEAEDPGEGVFQRVTEALRRCIDAGRFHRVDAATSGMWAGQLWTMHHGAVTLACTGLVPVDQAHALLSDMTYRLAIGYGDNPAAARHSVDQGTQMRTAKRAAPRTGPPSGTTNS